MRRLTKVLAAILVLSMLLSNAIFAEEPLEELEAYVVEKTATPASSKFIVDGKEIQFEFYNINGFNYFKLRDLAYILSGTEKQFDVEYSNGYINLVSNKSYTVVGGELSKSDGLVKTATQNMKLPYKDSLTIMPEIYNIEGYNYFKLRDIGESFDFGVSWDNINNAIIINTSIGYEESQNNSETTDESAETLQMGDYTVLSIEKIKDLSYNAFKTSKLHSQDDKYYYYIDLGEAPDGFIWTPEINLYNPEGELIGTTEFENMKGLSGEIDFEIISITKEDITNGVEVVVALYLLPEDGSEITPVSYAIYTGEQNKILEYIYYPTESTEWLTFDTSSIFEGWN